MNLRDQIDISYVRKGVEQLIHGFFVAHDYYYNGIMSRNR